MTDSIRSLDGKSANFSSDKRFSKPERKDDTSTPQQFGCGRAFSAFVARGGYANGSSTAPRNENGYGFGARGVFIKRGGFGHAGNVGDRNGSAAINTTAFGVKRDEQNGATLSSDKCFSKPEIKDDTSTPQQFGCGRAFSAFVARGGYANGSSTAPRNENGYGLGARGVFIGRGGFGHAGNVGDRNGSAAINTTAFGVKRDEQNGATLSSDKCFPKPEIKDDTSTLPPFGCGRAFSAFGARGGYANGSSTAPRNENGYGFGARGVFIGRGGFGHAGNVGDRNSSATVNTTAFGIKRDEQNEQNGATLSSDKCFSKPEIRDDTSTLPPFGCGREFSAFGARGGYANGSLTAPRNENGYGLGARGVFIGRGGFGHAGNVGDRNGSATVNTTAFGIKRDEQNEQNGATLSSDKCFSKPEIRDDTSTLPPFGVGRAFSAFGARGSYANGSSTAPRNENGYGFGARDVFIRRGGFRHARNIGDRNGSATVNTTAFCVKRDEQNEQNGATLFSDKCFSKPERKDDTSTPQQFGCGRAFSAFVARGGYANGSSTAPRNENGYGFGARGVFIGRGGFGHAGNVGDRNGSATVNTTAFGVKRDEQNGATLSSDKCFSKPEIRDDTSTLPPFGSGSAFGGGGALRSGANSYSNQTTTSRNENACVYGLCGGFVGRGGYGVTPPGSFSGRSQQTHTKADPSPFSKPTTHVLADCNVEKLFAVDRRNAAKYRAVAEDDEDISVGESHKEMSAAGQRANVCAIDSWNDAKFHFVIVGNIEKAKYYRPRKIQAYVIPAILDGFDVRAHAETGSGKTVAFMAPIIDQLIKAKEATTAEEFQGEKLGQPRPRALVIEPARELCLQVYSQGLKLASGSRIAVRFAYGEYPLFENYCQLQKGCDVLCATPGRLITLLTGPFRVDLSQLKYFVLDEADRLLDCSFIPQLRKIILSSQFPKKENRQTMLFSATFPEEVQRLANDVLHNDIFLSLKNRSTIAANSRIVQNFFEVQTVQKKQFLMEILRGTTTLQVPTNVKRTLVFVNTKRSADLLAIYLSENDLKATTINADRTQKQRELALKMFHDNDIRILVSTDVCARGIDVNEMDHVINFDLPSNPITYVHRIGRTGRLCGGFSTSFFDPTYDKELVPDLVQIIREAGQDPPDFMKNLLVSFDHPRADDQVSLWNRPSACGFVTSGGVAAPPTDGGPLLTIADADADITWGER